LFRYRGVAGSALWRIQRVAVSSFRHIDCCGGLNQSTAARIATDSTERTKGHLHSLGNALNSGFFSGPANLPEQARPATKHVACTEPSFDLIDRLAWSANQKTKLMIRVRLIINQLIKSHGVTKQVWSSGLSGGISGHYSCCAARWDEVQNVRSFSCFLSYL